MGSVKRFKNKAARFINSRYADLAHSITIESPSLTADGQGGFIPVWTTFATVECFSKTTSAKEFMHDSHITAENLRRFSFQYVAGITSQMRINYAGVMYNIHTIKSSADSTIWTKIIASANVAT